MSLKTLERITSVRCGRQGRDLRDWGEDLVLDAVGVIGGENGGTC